MRLIHSDNKFKIPKPLEAFDRYKNFILWRSEKTAEKINKIPCSPKTGKPTSVHDETHFTDYDSAKRAAIKYNLNIGYVFTEKTPFWFLDIDGCISDNGWNELSTQLYNELNGAAVEVSQSGKGVHIFGTGNVPEHACKNVDLKMELYTQSRFVALSFNQLTGSATTDCTKAISKVVRDYFPVKAKIASNYWTSEPIDQWQGPEDDKELLKKMLKSKSLRNAFGNRVSFKDLWQGNEKEIAKTYPAIGSDECLFDRSSADAALCLQLAWWTGHNCERMENLFEQSALVRQKWLERDDYRETTILNAVEQCVGCYGSEKTRREMSAIDWEDNTSETLVSNRIELLSGPRIVAFNDRASFFKNHYFLRASGRVLCPDNVIRGQTEYNACYGNYEFQEVYGDQKPLREPWKAYVTALDVKRLEVHDTIYEPSQEQWTITNKQGLNYVNTYINTDIERIPGDVSPFLIHIDKILPNKRNSTILLSYLAAFVQYPGVKFRWAPFLQGAEGCGKSIFGRILANCIGDKHIHYINPEEFYKGTPFNKWMIEKRLAIIEEIRVGSRKQADTTLKRFIDHGQIEIQAKYEDQKTCENKVNFLLCSNFKDALPIVEMSRRYAPLFCAQQSNQDIIDCEMGGDYFTNLWNWLYDKGFNHIFDYLHKYKIPDEFNPTTGAKAQAPKTTCFKEAIDESRPEYECNILGMLSSDCPGTRDGWVSVQAIRNLLQQEQTNVSAHLITKVLTQNGYVLHPLLSKNRGRLHHPVMQEGGAHVKLFLKKDHPVIKLATTAKHVRDLYCQAQGYSL